MKRVGLVLARGIAAAALLAFPGEISDPQAPAPRAERALAFIRSQDFSPVYTTARRRIGGFFRGMRQEEFLDEVFSLSGKWKALAWGRASYERYLREMFEKHLFNPDRFAEILEKIREDCAVAMAASDNRLLVVLQEDLLVGGSRPDFPALKAGYAGLAESLAPMVLRDVGMNGVSIAGSEAAAVLLVAALTSAGVLGGSAAGGAAGGPWTFGVSLVAGIAAGAALDAVVGDAWEEAAAMELRRHLHVLRWRTSSCVQQAVFRAMEAHRRLQEECVLELCGGGRHEILARGR